MIPWRKSQAPSLPSTKSTAKAPIPVAKPTARAHPTIHAVPMSDESPPRAKASELAPAPIRAQIVIGSSIQIKGELIVDGDLLLDGRVEGRVLVGKHCLTVGPNARLTANLHADTIKVLGTVVGTLSAESRVEIQESATVEGDVHARQVAIAEGSNFRGSINKNPSSPPAQVVLQEIEGAIERTLAGR